MSNAKHDDNWVPTLIAVSTVDGVTPVKLEADPVTGNLKVDATATIDTGDIEIGAVEIKNSTDDTRATVGANGLYTDVQASALPTGAATAAKQLPDGHNVVVTSAPAVTGTVTANLGTLTAPLTIVGAGAGATALRTHLSDESLSALENITVISSGTVTATLNAETTKVIGTVNQGTSPWVVSATDLDIRNLTNADVVTAELSAVDNAVLDSLVVELKLMNGAYAMQVDDTGTTLYQGWAVPGTLTSAASWRIRRVVSSGTPTDTSITFADGDDSFNNVWDNRAALSYS